MFDPLDDPADDGDVAVKVAGRMVTSSSKLRNAAACRASRHLPETAAHVINLPACRARSAHIPARVTSSLLRSFSISATMTAVSVSNREITWEATSEGMRSTTSTAVHLLVPICPAS